MPQIHSAFPAGVIITNGLGADAASGSLITASKWNLFGCSATITIAIEPSGGGGSRPFMPGEIQNFYRPVIQNDLTQDYIQTNLEYNLKNRIIVKFKYNDIENEKEFVLNQKPYNIVIKILNVINITNNIANVVLKNIKTKIHNISVNMKKIKIKD